MTEKLLKKLRRALEVTTQIPILNENWEMLKRKVIFYDSITQCSSDKGQLIARLKKEHDIANFVKNSNATKDTAVYVVQNGNSFEYGDFDTTQESIFIFYERRKNTGEIYLYQP